MRTARMTVLMTPEEKAEIEVEAARLGVSGGEYVRLAVDNFDRPTAAEEAELAALVEQANEAIPKMSAALDRMIATLEATNFKMAATLRAAGIRP